jgi:hypothetical protein
MWLWLCLGSLTVLRSSIVACVFVAAGTYLPSRCLSTTWGIFRQQVYLISFLLFYQNKGKGKGKGKAIPITGREDPLGCETSRLPHLLDNRLMWHHTWKPEYRSQRRRPLLANVSVTQQITVAVTRSFLSQRISGVYGYTLAKLWCNKYGAYSEKLTNSIVEEETPFQNM